jgi:hypothetical protein
MNRRVFLSLALALAAASARADASQTMVEKWEWNGFRMGMPVAEAREMLSKSCRGSIQSEPSKSAFKTTLLYCIDSTITVAGVPVSVELMSYGGVVIDVSFHPRDIADKKKNFDQWYTAVCAGLRDKYGPWKENEFGPKGQLSWHTDRTLTIIADDMRKRRNTVFFSVAYIDSKAWERRDADEGADYHRNAKKAAKDL